MSDRRGRELSRWARGALLISVALAACSGPSGPTAGEGSIEGAIVGLSLTCAHGVATARSFPPGTEIKIARDSLSCAALTVADRLTIDLGAAAVGDYAVVLGFPPKPRLAGFQARAHACPAERPDGTQPPCHDQVRGGSVTITRYDAAIGGRIEGSFAISFADGDVSGSFSAVRCD